MSEIQYYQFSERSHHLKFCTYNYIHIIGVSLSEPHIYVVNGGFIYIYCLFRGLGGAIYAGCKMDKMAALCAAIACDSNACHRQLQTRRTSYEMK